MAMMFAGLSKKRGPFDPPETYSTPGIGDGLPGAAPMGDPGLGALQMAPQGKPDFFGAGGSGRNIAGYIGDALAQLGGMEPVYAPQMQRRSDEQRKLSLYQQQRRDGLEDFATKQQIEAKYKPAPAATELERLAVAAGYTPGTPDYTAALRQGFNNRINPIQGVPITNADGSQGLRFIRPSDLQGGGDPTSGGGGGIQSPAPSSGGFMTLGQFKSMLGAPTFKPGHPAWSTPVQVTSKAEMDQLPSGKTFIAPDGSVRTKR